MAIIYPKSSFIILITAIILIISPTYSFKNSGFTLDLIHRDSINNNRLTNLRNAFRRSFARQRSLSLASRHGSSSSSSSPSDSNFNATLAAGNGEYLMTIKIGTPPVEITAIADTGSDLTWTQCVPCNDCYDQNQPLFDPNKTSTYSQVSCSAALCSDEGFDGSCSDSKQCLYSVSYGDGSYADGDLASETFTFDSDSGDQSLTVPNVVFGCGQEDVGTYPNTSSGIIGLGGSNVSIIRQLDSYINGRFSYCLTSYDSTATSKISFGSNAVVSGPNVVSTPLLRGDNDTTFYFVTLQGITVGGQKFSLSPNNNRKNADDDVQQGNMIVDSGTTVTIIPESLYESVESAVANQTTGTRVDDPLGDFDLCYDASKDIKPPKIVANFDGADVVLPENGIFVELIEEGIACFTLVGSGPYDDVIGIFGNLHQMNYHVGFDLKKMELSFSPTDCSKGQ